MQKFGLFGKITGPDSIVVSFVVKKKILIAFCGRFKDSTWVLEVSFCIKTLGIVLNRDYRRF